MRKLSQLLVLSTCVALAAGCKKREEGSVAKAKIHRGEMPPAGPDVERWGFLVKIGLQSTELIVDFRKEMGRHSAVLGIPARKIYGIPLREVSVSDTELRFTLAKPRRPKASEVYHAKRSNPGAQVASGAMKFLGMTVPIKLKRLRGPFVSLLRRPQTPKPPFPYTSREIVAVNSKDNVRRAGTLTIPSGRGKHPVVILESGSGPHDRNGGLAGHKPYWVIADYLTRNGIAVLRTDDRGVGRSTGNDGRSTYDQLANDVLAMVEVLKKQPEIDPKRIGVMGHSQGGTIAPLAAARSDDVAFVVMLCGMGVPGDQVMYDQKRLVLESMGVRGEALAKRMKHQRRLLDLVLKDASDDILREAITKGLSVEITAAQRAQMTPALKRRLVGSGTAMITAPVIRSLVKNKPGRYLSKIKVPLFAIFGEKDLQVEPKSNEAGVRRHLTAAGNKRFSTWIVPKMSHNFQRSDTGRIEEYGTITETVRPVLLKRLTAWIRGVTKAG